MGYSIDLFLESSRIDEEFICSICHEVLEAPMLIETCEHIFCSSCLTEWRSSSNTCPFDRETINGVVKPPNRAFLNLLSRFQLCCKFSELGCNSILELGNMQQHHSICQHNPDLVKPCTGGCGAELDKASILSHNCIEYLKREVKTKGIRIQQLEQVVVEMENEIFGRQRETLEAHVQSLSIAQNSNPNLAAASNPRVFLTISLEDVEVGNVVIELRADVVPRTAEDFRVYCTGERGNGYKGEKAYCFPKFGLGVGYSWVSRGGHEIERISSSGRSLKPENYVLKHDVPGTVSLNTSFKGGYACEFYITLTAMPGYDGNCVVFGKVVEGFNIIQLIEKFGETGMFRKKQFLISNCGQC